MKIGRNDICHCGSGKKYKKCCFSVETEEIKKSNRYRGVIVHYGPDNQVATKVVVSILESFNSDFVDMKKWFSEPESGDIRNNQKVLQETVDFLKLYDLKDVTALDRICGCPHEEGIDYPENESCPVCPFWANRDRWNS